MSHLSAERIAALVDESPTAAELSHLAACADCERERARFASLAELAKIAPAITAPLTSWERLAPALRADGLIVGAPRAPYVNRPNPLNRGHRGWIQAAAAVLLVAGGVMAGRVTAGADMLPVAFKSDSVRALPRFTSVAEAERARVDADRVSQAATMFLVNADPTSQHSVTPRTLDTRLASLGATIQALTADLHETHNDPVISHMRETTRAQYEATIRQINAMRPASQVMTAY